MESHRIFTRPVILQHMMRMKNKCGGWASVQMSEGGGKSTFSLYTEGGTSPLFLFPPSSSSREVCTKFGDRDTLDGPRCCGGKLRSFAVFIDLYKKMATPSRFASCTIGFLAFSDAMNFPPFSVEFAINTLRNDERRRSFFFPPISNGIPGEK